MRTRSVVSPEIDKNSAGKEATFSDIVMESQKAFMFDLMKDWALKHRRISFLYGQSNGLRKKISKN